MGAECIFNLSKVAVRELKIPQSLINMQAQFFATLIE